MDKVQERMLRTYKAADIIETVYVQYTLDNEEELNKLPLEERRKITWEKFLAIAKEIESIDDLENVWGNREEFDKLSLEESNKIVEEKCKEILKRLK